MSLTRIKRIGLPLAAAVAVSVAVAAPAMATPASPAANGTFKTWAKAQNAAGFRLLRPGTTYGLRSAGQISVGTCETSPRKRIVSAYYGSFLKTGLGLEQNNAGKSCSFGSTAGRKLGTYRFGGHTATLYGYCGYTGTPACTSTKIELWLVWKSRGNYYIASSHDQTRARLVHFAATLKKV
jgi:hypothetical protein